MTNDDMIQLHVDLDSRDFSDSSEKSELVELGDLAASPFLFSSAFSEIDIFLCNRRPLLLVCSKLLILRIKSISGSS